MARGFQLGDDVVGFAAGLPHPRAGEISEETACTALRALPEMIDYRYPHTGRLADRAWELGHTITFYDGLYVALAAVLDVPLLTADVGLSKAPGLSCAVLLIS